METRYCLNVTNGRVQIIHLFKVTANVVFFEDRKKAKDKSFIFVQGYNKRFVSPEYYRNIRYNYGGWVRTAQTVKVF